MVMSWLPLRRCAENTLCPRQFDPPPSALFLSCHGCVFDDISVGVSLSDNDGGLYVYY
jgi:hypothetical protein